MIPLTTHIHPTLPNRILSFIKIAVFTIFQFTKLLSNLLSSIPGVLSLVLFLNIIKEHEYCKHIHAKNIISSILSQYTVIFNAKARHNVFYI